MAVEEPTDDFITIVDDSRRWAAVPTRPDDIVISTPPKSGTTWTQGIVSALLWPDGDAPGSLGDRTTWPDMRTAPIEDVVEKLDGMEHRRFIKTHSPADCVPFDDDLKYVLVYRDGRDAFMSWTNHRTHMLHDVIEVLNENAADDDCTPWHRYEGDHDLLFDEWTRDCNPIRHLASWWPRRRLPNVLFLHYADMLAEPEQELRRLADFLDIDVSDDQWPGVLDEITIDSMRTAAEDSDNRWETLFAGGAGSFFNQGTNDRWVGVLDDDLLASYDEMTTTLPGEAAGWLEQGSIAFGRRPPECE